MQALQLSANFVAQRSVGKCFVQALLYKEVVCAIFVVWSSVWKYWQQKFSEPQKSWDELRRASMG